MQILQGMCQHMGLHNILPLLQSMPIYAAACTAVCNIALNYRLLMSCLFTVLIATYSRSIIIGHMPTAILFTAVLVR